MAKGAERLVANYQDNDEFDLDILVKKATYAPVEGVGYLVTSDLWIKAVINTEEK